MLLILDKLVEQDKEVTNALDSRFIQPKFSRNFVRKCVIWLRPKSLASLKLDLNEGRLAV